MNTGNDYLARIKALEQENQALRRQLERSHTDLTRLEESNEKQECLLRQVIQDLNQTEMQLQTLVAGTAGALGSDFFPALAENMASAMGVTYAIVSEYTAGKFHSLAFWADQALQPNFEYISKATPCELTLKNGFFYCETGLQQAFPEDQDLVDMGVDSYLGIALRNAQGEAIGNLCILNPEPIKNPERAEQILGVFATRATAELERKRAIASLEQLNRDLEDRVEERTHELEQREARYRALVEVIPDLMIRLHADGTFLDIVPGEGFKVLNPDLFRLGANIYGVIPFDQAQQRMSYVRRALATREVQTYDYELVVGGESRFEEARIVALDDQEVLIMIRDITDRKQSEEQLKASEQRFRQAIENAPFPIMIHADDGAVLQVNAIWTELTGYTHQDLPTVREWAHRAYGDRADAVLKNVIAKEYTLDRRWEEREFTITIHDGSQRIWSFSAAPLGTLPDGRRVVISMAADVTQRRQTEVALRESEEKYRSLYDQASVGVVNVTLDGKFIEINSCFCDMMGYSREELLSKTVADITYPADRALTEPNIKRLFSGETQFFFQEKRYLRRDGSFFWASVGVSLVRDAEGDVEHILAVIQDITSRKEAEIANRQSQQFLQTVLNTFPLNVFWKDRQSVYLGCNTNFARDAGLSTPGDIVGQTDYEMPWADTEATAFRADDREVMETGVAKLGIIETLLKADGSQIWLETNKIPLRNLEGEVIGVLGTYQDITDRKRAEFQINALFNRTQLLNYISAEIRESLDLEIILQNSVNAISAGLAASSCTFAWYQHTECQVLDIVKEQKTAELPSAIGTYRLSDVPSLFEHIEQNRLYRIDDHQNLADEPLKAFLQSIGLATFLCLPIHTTGGRIGSLQIGRTLGEKPWTNDEVELLQDIGNQMAIAIYQAQLYEESQSKTQELKRSYQELQEAQLQLIQSEKMSSLGQLVAGIAHEINNPINFISGNLAIASEYVTTLTSFFSQFQQHHADIPPDFKRLIENREIEYIINDFPQLLGSMDNGTERICRIVQSLRTFSRLDQADYKAVNLHENIDSTLVILQNRLNGRAGNPEIQLVKEYGKIPLIECYSGLLNQVLMNLLVNAIDAIEEKQARSTEDYSGCITIQTRLAADDKVSISIKDNGPGMDQQTQEKIFNPFFTTKPIGIGTGMGLSISYQIVTGNHQGQLACVSTPGQGTEFVIELWRSLPQGDRPC